VKQKTTTASITHPMPVRATTYPYPYPYEIAEYLKANRDILEQVLFEIGSPLLIPILRRVGINVERPADE
jgi:hypothetical protein